MGNFNRGNRSGGDRFGGGHRSGADRSFGGRRDFNSMGGDRPMFQTICSKCGKECEVPFKPTGDRPVFCRDCFRENGGGESRNEERNFSRPSFENRERAPQGPQLSDQLQELNSKLDKVLNLLTSAITEDVVSEEASEPQEEQEEIAVPEKKKRASKKSS